VLGEGVLPSGWRQRLPALSIKNENNRLLTIYQGLKNKLQKIRSSAALADDSENQTVFSISQLTAAQHLRTSLFSRITRRRGGLRTEEIRVMGKK
jgi:hypothetical protein